MKLQFSDTQQHQLRAVESVVSLFEGQPLAQGNFEVSFGSTGTSLAYTEQGIGNNLVLKEEQLLANLHKVQASNGLKLSDKLVPSLSENGKETYTRFNFTIEMETGTGKTYTFLRTIYELHKTYGFKKYVIVVPSVAIREGTIKNLAITHEHFQALYQNQSINFVMYDRGNLTTLRNFATSNAIQILVINVDSFAKDSNVINQQRDSTNGAKPIEYIQATRPIVIIDEPQNFETDARRQAIENLHPLCTLRYSATHRNFYNLAYSLNPVQAYDLGLVKQIEVTGITADSNYNAAFIQLKKIEAGKKTIKAKVTIYVNDLAGAKPKDITLDLGDDLFLKSNGRDIYKDRFILTEIRAEDGEIEFSNGTIVRTGEAVGGLNDDIMKFQIEQTIKHHFAKIKKMRDKGERIKVLSLFFIDKVANYRQYDSEGNFEKGKFALWFEEYLQKYQKANPDYLPFEPEQLHNGYFSSDKAGKGKKDTWADTKGTTAKDDDTYTLIMKDKERLLSLEEPLQFIFSHSALREGWDNPNVFQICTLNESKSDLKKRQEIGRGLRLPVNSVGERVQDKSINVLTVIANETYEDFTKALQKEIQEETSVDFGNRIKNAREKVKLEPTKELNRDTFPLFFEIWDRISHQTRYAVQFDKQELIKRAVEEIKAMPPTVRPMLESQTVKLQYTEEGIDTTLTSATRKESTTHQKLKIPDIFNYIQSKIDLTRQTIYQILIQSDRYKDLEINAQMFLDNFIAKVRSVLNALLVEGVKYYQINGKQYAMSLFDSEELETYLANIFPNKNDKIRPLTKTLWNAIPYEEDANKERTYKTEQAFQCVPIDSGTESQFAQDCELDENIKFFFKLPRGFRIPTPLGDYIPDWAVIFENDKRIYFVAETKSSLDELTRRGIENLKIQCGKKHFALFKSQGVEYRTVTQVKELYS